MEQGLHSGVFNVPKSISCKSLSLILSIRLQRNTSKFPEALLCNAVRLVAIHAEEFISQENTKQSFLSLFSFTVRFAKAVDIIPDPGPTSRAKMGFLFLI